MTARLIGLIKNEWSAFDGLLASQDVDPMLLPFDRFLNTVHWWATKEATQESLTRFERRLWMPPKGEAPAPGSPWSPEAETAAFASLAAQVGAVDVAAAAQLRPAAEPVAYDGYDPPADPTPEPRLVTRP